MRIALVHSFYRSEASGENTAVIAQARALEESGNKVEVISRSTADQIGSPLYLARSSLTVMAGFGPSPLEEIQRFEPDIVHVHNLFPNWSERWVWQLKAPLVTTVHNFRAVCAAGTLSRQGMSCHSCPAQSSLNAIRHGCYQESKLKSVPLALYSRPGRKSPLFTASRKIIFLSRRSKDILLRWRQDIEPSKVATIPNFVDERADSSQAFGAKKLGRYWLFVGRLSAEKGLAQLLRVWPASIPLVVVGSGPEEEGLGRMSTTNTQFLGYRHPDEVRQLMGEAVGLVFPSVSPENSPLTVIEAFQLGLPVVAKDGNSVADLVRDTGAGLVARRFEDFPAALASLDANREEFSRKARATFEREFSKEQWLSRIMAVYRLALDSGPR